MSAPRILLDLYADVRAGLEETGLDSFADFSTEFLQGNEAERAIAEEALQNARQAAAGVLTGEITREEAVAVGEATAKTLRNLAEAKSIRVRLALAEVFGGVLTKALAALA